MVVGTFSAVDIREVKRVRSVDGYEAVILSYDENISYYIIPWNMAELSPFGEITAFTSNDQDKGAASSDRIAQLLGPKVQPRPNDAPPQLIDKHPSQFSRETRLVVGVIATGANEVEIDGKRFELFFKKVDGVPSLAVTQTEASKNLLQKIAARSFNPIMPGTFLYEVYGTPISLLVVHARDGSWRYRVQIPEPVQ